jgi:hypothetical protein
MGITWRAEMHTILLWKTLRERDYFKNSDEDESNIKMDGFDSGQRKVADSCKCSNKFFDSTTCKEFLD